MMIRGFMTFFVWLFLVDGIMSLVLEVLKLDGGNGGWFMGPQFVMAGMTFLVALTFYAFSAFYARLPKRIIVPATLFLAWANLCGAFPLEIWLKGQTGLCLSILQCGLGGLFLLCFRGREEFFPLRNPAEHRAEFSWRSLVLYILGNAVLAPVLFVLFVLGATVGALEKSTDGFVTVRPAGIFIQERKFAKEDRRVHLIGMMHIANAPFYDSILKSFPTGAKSVVLLEGVSDRNNVLKSDLGMKRLGKLLGLDAQSDSEFTAQALKGLAAEGSGKANGPIRYLRSDRDISDFRPETIACLLELGNLAASPSWEEFFRRQQNPDSPFHDERNARLMMEDILNGRNQFLLAKIEESLSEYEHVIVPWGAMHMPFLERKLLEKGFREVGREDRKALAF